MMFFGFKIPLGYEEALWPKKLEISHASQILTNDRQIWVLSYLPNLITTVMELFENRIL